MTTKKALVLLSGGLDSTTVLAYATNQGYKCSCISFEYDQNHKIELQAAKNTSKNYGVSEHLIYKLDNSIFQSSSLVNKNIEISNFQASKTTPSTYVPARNLVFLSIAAAFAKSKNISNIFIGTCADDFDNYPDCRPQFLESCENTINLATKTDDWSPLKIHAPLINLSKKETILLGIKNNVDYSQTISCYRATSDFKSCGQCLSCHLRKQGFAEANIQDPTIYIKKAII